jgi:RimJ/RimL family protein N-acetyltransferase
VTTLLESERLVLRPIALTDLDDWYEQLRSDEDVRRFLPPGEHYTREMAGRSLGAAVERWKSNRYGVWVTAKKSSGDFVGHCGLVDLAEAGGGIELAYAVRPEHRGNGYATEAARAVLGFAFEELKLAEVAAIVAAPNTASRRVLDHLGLTLEQEVFYHGLPMLRYSARRPDALHA